jgi:IS30 family transposase
VSPKCPNCGWEPPKGRPKKLDDAKIRKLHKQGKSLAELAKKFGVTRGAIQASLKRSTEDKQ